MTNSRLGELCYDLPRPALRAPQREEIRLDRLCLIPSRSAKLCFIGTTALNVAGPQTVVKPTEKKLADGSLLSCALTLRQPSVRRDTFSFEAACVTAQTARKSFLGELRNTVPPVAADRFETNDGAPDNRTCRFELNGI